jgi:hypothetical protein
MVTAMEMQMKPLTNARQIEFTQYRAAIRGLAEALEDGKKLEAVLDIFLPEIIGYEGAVELDISDEFTRAVLADIELRAKGGFFDFNAVMRDLYRRAAWNSVQAQVEREQEFVRQDRRFDQQIDSLGDLWRSDRELAAMDAGVSAYGAL